MTRLLLVAVGCVGLAAAQEPKPSPLDGSWSLTTAELGGNALPESVTKTFTLILDGDRYTLKSGGPDDTGRGKRDDAKTPKHMDVTGEAGPNKGKTFLAIYELSGDTLKVCYDLDGKQRPAEFKTAAGTKQFLAVYKRKAK